MANPENTASVKKVSSVIKKRQKSKRRKLFRVWFKRLSILTLILLCGYGIYRVDASELFKVKQIVIAHNTIYSDNQIKKLLNIDIGDRTWLIYPWLKANRIKDDRVIAEVDLSIKNNILLVSVNEYRLVGVYKDRLLLENGHVVNYLAHHQPIVDLVPLIEGFESEEYQLRLAEALAQLEPMMLFAISMIQQKQTSYDEAQLHLLLKDQNQVFSDFRSLSLLNDYRFFVNQIKPENKCIYIDAISSSAISQPCENE